MITRRTVGRLFLLRPSLAVNLICKYVLAAAAKRFSVDVHAYCFLSNHFHLVLTDRAGQLPKFMHWIDLFLSKCINEHLGRWGCLWEPGSYSMVVLGDADAVLSRLEYVLVNPVKAGLVCTHAAWPGLVSRVAQIGGDAVRVEPPSGFFAPVKGENAVVELSLTPPPQFEELPIDEFRSRLEARVRRREREIQDEFKRAGRRFLGAAAVLKLPRDSTPWCIERRRTLNPRIACRDSLRRREILQKLRGFFESYREAMRQYLEGVRDVLFPAGTWWMRVQFGVQCLPP